MPGQLAAIGVVAKDVGESVRFYRTLGVDVSDPTEGEDHHEATLPNGLRLMWDTVELIQKLDPGWAPPQGYALSLAFECESPADVDATFAAIVDAGFRGTVEPYDAFWGQRYAHLEDPDGNVVHLFAAL